MVDEALEAEPAPEQLAAEERAWEAAYLATQSPPSQFAVQARRPDRTNLLSSYRLGQTPFTQFVLCRHLK